MIVNIEKINFIIVVYVKLFVVQYMVKIYFKNVAFFIFFLSWNCTKTHKMNFIK